MHKFQADQTIFYYDCEISGIHTKDKAPLSVPHHFPQEYIEYVTSRNLDSHKAIQKSDKPVMIKIILGHRCNFSCGYCLQSELSSKCDGEQRAKEKAKALSLKDNISIHLNLADLKRIELWGGETFLYWHEIQALMEEFDRDGLTWYLPTNGTLIDQRHIDFFKTMKGTVCIGISHDGPAHTITRGPDFLERSVDVIRALQDAHPKIQFSFNPVISNKNYDLFAINRFFRDYLTRHNLSNVPLMYEIIQVYNLAEVRGDSRSYALMGEDLDRYKTILKDYLHAHFVQAKTLPRDQIANGDLLITNLYELHSGAMDFAKSLGMQDVMHSGAKCQADQPRQLSMDMDGNVRTCQNVGKEAIFGNISDINNVRVTNLDTNQGPHCATCRVRFLCNGQCPIKQHEDVFATNCKINKVHYSAIQDAAFEYLFGTEVTYLGVE